MKELGYDVLEQDMTYTDLFHYINSKEIMEAFGTGIEADISPVGLIEYKGINYHISDTIGPLAQRLYDSLNDIK